MKRKVNSDFEKAFESNEVVAVRCEKGTAYLVKSGNEAQAEVHVIKGEVDTIDAGFSKCNISNGKLDWKFSLPKEIGKVIAFETVSRDELALLEYLETSDEEGSNEMTENVNIVGEAEIKVTVTENGNLKKLKMFSFCVEDGEVLRHHFIKKKGKRKYKYLSCIEGRGIISEITAQFLKENYGLDSVGIKAIRVTEPKKPWVMEALREIVLSAEHSAMHYEESIKAVSPLPIEEGIVPEMVEVSQGINKGEGALSLRGKQWLEFSNAVLDHIENYTVPQYGDAPNDNVENYTPQECMTHAVKYVSRSGKNVREGQDKLDMFKLAHYACLAHSKLGK